jgi:DNA replication protein DnaC
MAYTTGNTCFRRYIGAYYISVTDIVGSLLQDGRDYAERLCKKYQRETVVIDDLGQEIGMQYFGTPISKFIELIIERRYQRFEMDGTMTVIATNLQPADLETTYDARTVSRLAAMCEIVPFNGADWRKRT